MTAGDRLHPLSADTSVVLVNIVDILVVVIVNVLVVGSPVTVEIIVTVTSSLNTVLKMEVQSLERRAWFGPLADCITTLW